MNPLQIDKLQPLLNDELLVNTIRASFNETIDKNIPVTGAMESNALIGEKFRAYETAKSIVEDCFFNLLTHKKSEKVKGTFNKAI